MADRFHVLALDLRGHGESDHAADYMAERVAGDLEAFVEMLDLRRLSIVGFSAGGGAACTYAARHPERVERLAENFTGRGPEALAHLTIQRSLPQVFDAPEEAATAFRPLAPYASAAELQHWMRSGLIQRPDGRWAWRYDPVFRQPGAPGRLAPVASAVLDSLAKVTCPILLVVGVVVRSRGCRAHGVSESPYPPGAHREGWALGAAGQPGGVWSGGEGLPSWNVSERRGVAPGRCAARNTTLDAFVKWISISHLGQSSPN
jgi:hypothetical protein